MYPYFSLNDDEKAEYEHATIVIAIRESPRTISNVYAKAHDRIYGARAACAYCREPFLNNLEAAYGRPPLDPTTTASEKRRTLGPESGLRDLMRELFGPQGGASNDPSAE